MAKSCYVGLYGNVRLVKAYCRSCHADAFVSDGKLQCCDSAVEADPTLYKRHIEPEQIRRRPSKAKQEEQLALQDNRCLYCQRPFGSTIWRNDRPVKLRIHWDHQMPYCYGQDNRECNFVAACQVCNQIKSSYCFQTVDEARVHILGRQAEKGYSASAYGG